MSASQSDSRDSGLFGNTATTGRAASLALFERARKVIPGGVNSPVRAFKSVGGSPPFIACAKGPSLWDVDGNEYVDYVASWGPMLHGHAPDEVLQAVEEALMNGTSFGAPTEREVEMAELLTSALPSMDMVRLVCSGTEATMAALRVARGFTGRDRIVKIDGGYHGHADSLLVDAGSGAATLGIPGSAGVTAAAARDTVVVPWNDAEAMARALDGRDVAAVIVEPVCGNMGCVPPRPGYLERLRELCDATGTVLIFDEVMTGFRVAWGGAQLRYGVRPDLTCLGKIIGGGLPLGAYGGRRDLMSLVAPEGPVYQAGTLAGNPLAVAAGLANLHLCQREGVYEQLERTTAALVDGLAAIAREAGVPARATRVGSMFTVFFTEREVWSYADAKTSDTARFARWHRGMLDLGVYLAPSQYEAGFVSTTHDERSVARTLEMAARVMKTI